MRKTSQDSRYPGRDSNQASPKYANPLGSNLKYGNNVWYFSLIFRVLFVDITMGGWDRWSAFPPATTPGRVFPLFRKGGSNTGGAQCLPVGRKHYKSLNRVQERDKIWPKLAAETQRMAIPEFISADISHRRNSSQIVHERKMSRIAVFITIMNPIK
jgi:hypothetical protein